MIQLTSRVNKAGQLVVYAISDRKRKATPEQRKEFLKMNYEAVKKETVSPDEWKQINRIKGGKARAKNAYTFKGQFISKKDQQKLIKEAKRNGIDINELMKGNKVENFKDLFKKRPGIQKRLDKIFTTTGLPYWFSIFNYTKEIREADRDIFVNSSPVSKEQALKEIDDVITTLVSKYQPAGGIIKFAFVGIKELYVLDTLTPEAADELDPDDPRELDEYSSEIILFISKPKKDEKQKGKKHNRRK